jgi:hypothetical protein
VRYCFVVALLAACASGPSRVTMPDIEAAVAAPETAPPSQSVVPTLVPYPGIDVSYVANGEGEVYFCRRGFYCFFDGNWYRADGMSGPWDFVEMKYVPGDLYRARGHLPLALERQAREDGTFVELVAGGK